MLPLLKSQVAYLHVRVSIHSVEDPHAVWQRACMHTWKDASLLLVTPGYHDYEYHDYSCTSARGRMDLQRCVFLQVASRASLAGCFV